MKCPKHDDQGGWKTKVIDKHVRFFRTCSKCHRVVTKRFVAVDMRSKSAIGDAIANR